MKKSLKTLSSKWFAIKLTLALINDFRFPFTYVRDRRMGDVLTLVGVVKRVDTIKQLRSLADNIHKFADYLQKYPQVEFFPDME